MGKIETLRGQRIYLDTNIIIYIFEQTIEYAEVLTDLVRLIAQKGCMCVTAELTATEVLTGIAKRGDQADIDRCIEFFESGHLVSLRATSRNAFYQAGVLRAQMRIRVADSIHMMTAIESGCDVFLTNDKALSSFGPMKVTQLSTVQYGG